MRRWGVRISQGPPKLSNFFLGYVVLAMRAGKLLTPTLTLIITKNSASTEFFVFKAMAGGKAGENVVL